MKNMFKSIRRAPYQNISLTLSLISSLFIFIISVFSINLLYGLLNYAETRPQLTIYFKPSTEKSVIFKLRDEIINSKKTLKVKYISQNDALNIYKKLNKDNPLLIEMISPDIFPASLEIYAKKPSYLFQIADFVKNKKGVDDVMFEKNIINRLLTLTNIARKVTFFFLSYLLFVTIIILSTITMFKITLRKDEIEISRLLGASKTFVIKPFLNENIFIAILSSLISFGIFLGILKYLEPFINNYFQSIPELSVTFYTYTMKVWPFNLVFLLSVFGLELFFSIVIVSISTIVATRKYLNS